MRSVEWCPAGTTPVSRVVGREGQFLLPGAVHFVLGSARAHHGSSSSSSTSYFRNQRGWVRVIVVPSRAYSRHAWGSRADGAALTTSPGATGPSSRVGVRPRHAGWRGQWHPSCWGDGSDPRESSAIVACAISVSTIPGDGRDLGRTLRRSMRKAHFFTRCARLIVFESIFADLEERYLRAVKKGKDPERAGKSVICGLQRDADEYPRSRFRACCGLWTVEVRSKFEECQCSCPGMLMRGSRRTMCGLGG
ncbi:hypothetical protein DFH09DRAFT_1450507 [Mycena vulgaris]|nr:hypothetical protein DFH09DRAFT_1450507 [Mycena vulgaris]